MSFAYRVLADMLFMEFVSVVNFTGLFPDALQRLTFQPKGVFSINFKLMFVFL